MVSELTSKADRFVVVVKVMGLVQLELEYAEKLSVPTPQGNEITVASGSALQAPLG